MQILSADQVKQCDAYTITHEGISSLELMERAAKVCVTAILKYAAPDAEFVVFCGKGNNGGDGLAITRLLLQQQRQAQALLVHHTETISPGADANRQALLSFSKTALTDIRQAEHLHTIQLPGKTVLIDALLGIGINRPVDGLLADTIDFINSTALTVLSVDMPSGLYADSSSQNNGHIVKAHMVFTFQTPKLAFMLSENAPYVPRFEVIDIGLNPGFMASLQCNHVLLQPHHISFLFRPRSKFSHKGTYGHALLAGGSKAKSGAIILSAKACLRSGAGLLTVHSCADTLSSLLHQLPEAMCSYDEQAHISSLPKHDKYTVVGIGPGLGQEEDTQRALKLLIQDAIAPIVFDADAINILGANRTWLSFIRPGSVFTPHVKEFDRLTEPHRSDFDRLHSAVEFCQRYRQVLVLKGTYTAIISPSGKVYFNTTGNAALAKGGSGDVLTGMITGLMARGYEAEEACVIGVYIHGMAADICIEEQSPESVLASDIIGKIGQALMRAGA